jgi:acetyl-CoA/propionyl-CoA carboxylase biotin carboxyl carrier protein
MFTRVLIANRGEIAVRIIRTLRRLGISSVAVYSPADRRAPHVEQADLAVPLGGLGYLDADRLVAVAAETGAQAVHPGYGFLSENAAFARACAAAGIVFVGPPPDAIEAMGDKITAKRTVAASGVPVVPGSEEPGLDDTQLAEAARAVRLPVLLKPSAGGGGKGMHVVRSEEELADAIRSARREAVGAFGDPTLLVERYLLRPRHIEVQVFADGHGRCVALGERECSLQRRHQKIIEETPSPLLRASTRAAMADSAVAAARACGYVGAGTIEFIVSAERPDEYFFMEMNTRLQVEHPVTEMVLGLDLVELQLRVAAGEALPWASSAEVPVPTGHAVEARIYAEDPARGFLPSSGEVLLVRHPRSVGPVRVDSGLTAGLEVSTAYDPMLAKAVAWGQDRTSALTRLDRVLSEITVLGVTTNVGFLRRLLEDPAVRSGDLDTGLVERIMAGPAGPAPPGSEEAWRADLALVAATLLADGRSPGTGDAWLVGDGWRVGEPAALVTRWRIHGAAAGADPSEVVRVGGRVMVDGRDLGPVQGWQSGPRYVVEVAGRRASFDWCRDGEDLWLGQAGSAWRLSPARPARAASGGAGHGGGRITSPMPGTVLTVHVDVGQPVEAGQPLVVVEAMKMEHTVRANEPGKVAEVLVRVGDPVRLDQPLVVMEERSS